LTLVHLANPPLLSTLGQLPGVTTGRDNFAAQPTDVAVPGATTDDILNTLPLLNPTTGQQTLNQLVLGYPGFGFGVARSQAQQAVAANPTTIFLWAGNNEALAGVFAGTPAAMIPLSTFTTEYQNLIAYLNTKSSAHLVIGNIPDVTAIPYLQSATVLLGFFSQQTGAPISVLSAVLGIQPGDLVSLPGVQQVPGILGGTAKGPIASVNILHAADVPTVQANVAAYNKVIAASAQSAGATLVDINALFASITAKGITVNGVTGNVGYLGGVFSLDGIHPTNTAYAALANYFIDSMNTAFKQTAPDVNLVPIAAADPLFPPYPGHHAVEPVHGMAALTNMQLNSEQVRAAAPTRVRRIQILKPRVVRDVRHLHRPRRTVTLLGDDDLRLALQVFVLAIVVLLAMDKAHHVRVLLNRSRLTQVAQQRLLVAGPLLRST
jgi:phospholipase/lecithinase/hemolysin